MTEPFDIYMQETVNSIVTDFFKDPKNALMYTCDSADAREKLRLKKFNKWYNESPFKNEIVKLDDALGEGPITYVALLYHIDNPVKQHLELGYSEIIETLQKPEN